ncbi:MAG: LacI family DNA-binding transcriptional regulator [Prolixibacteraceae bacterium]|jgi:DNA-binding LacI/PurR family transcriptional regulator|nr:LacI family DNA-binding transcriptional regulator [Prolixibacteraceae bacterium]
MRSNQITIKDIARELGISPSTVSRALKDHPDISSDTKNAVKELAQKLNYQPNAVALSLKHSKSKTIGVIIPETVHFFFSSVISGIEDVAYDSGYNIMICQSNELYDREKSNANMLYSNRVDGLLVSISKETRDFRHLSFFQENNIPVVFFDRSTDAFPCDQIVIDDYAAAFNVTEYLISRGYKKLIHLAAPQNLEIGYKRRKGFQDALFNHGLPFSEDQIYYADKFESAGEAIEKIIRSNKLPDGIFAVNDLTALGALRMLRKNKIRVPEDIGLAGFGNGQNALLSDPPLTTVDQNGYEMGKKAGEVLLYRINNGLDDFKPVRHVVDTELIVRNSTL